MKYKQNDKHTVILAQHHFAQYCFEYGKLKITKVYEGKNVQSVVTLIHMETYRCLLCQLLKQLTAFTNKAQHKCVTYKWGGGGGDP